MVSISRQKLLQYYIQQLSVEALEAFETHGRGVFVTQLDARRIDYFKNENLHQIVTSQRFLDKITRSSKKYNPKVTFCLLIIASKEDVTFHIVRREGVKKFYYLEEFFRSLQGVFKKIFFKGSH